MDDPLPDHYKALGVANTVDAAVIKATYRKLVLKCHPDKVTDPALKEQKQEEFHNIQQAYECLIDDEKRSKYDAQITLDKLRKEKAARGGAPRDRTARFDVPTSGGASFAANGPSRYTTEYRAPRASEEDDRYHARYHAQPSKPTSSSRSTREKESKSSRHVKEDRSRSDREKTRSKETRSDRKFTQVDSESSGDEKARYEAAFKARTEEDARRKAEERRTYEDNRYAGTTTHTVPAARKMSVQEEEALRYQHKSRAHVEADILSSRPSPARASSRDYYTSDPPRMVRRDSARPEPVRRSSARPSKERPSLSRRDTDRTDRGIPEVVEWDDEPRREERRVPSFKHTTSSPAELSRGVPQRSYTESRSTRYAENTPPAPSLSRSSTMPTIPNTSSRRKDATAPRPSGLREAMTPEQYSSPEKYASPERDAFPSVPPSSTVKTYYYPVPGAGVSQDPPTPTPRHVVREPQSQRQHRSKSPIGKPPIGPNRPAEPTTASYKTVPRPSMPSRTESSRNISPVREERGRSGRLYGEIGSEPRHRVRQQSIDQNDVQYSRRYGPEDVRWAPRSGEPDRADRGYASKPTLGRTATYVY